ncbi:TRAP-type C4-dicarboxylate transport system permease small subunit [Palleronia aestuarii]|uniref:TRAP transporter small permease protein n=1 Tax=Palleronia aestuarii TaxID=568105 RepID=A0A2W7NIY9_9RHOB|nr:TRAP transporter small permease [Palleronia aestuarii]PZX19840.1 TRAP-type C4-dicarboxylate transport system permease small subunit [Palleronia aestuarii]
MPFSRLVFRVCGWLAGAALFMIAALILAQIALRLVGRQIPSADDFAAWSLSASIFLALPMALTHGDHIQVTSLRQLLPPRIDRAADLVASALALGIMGWGAWTIIGYVMESYTYGDVSQGIVATPLWIPQSAMAIGATLFALAFAERLVRLFLGLPVEVGHEADGPEGL